MEVGEGIIRLIQIRGSCEVGAAILRNSRVAESLITHPPVDIIASDLQHHCTCKRTGLSVILRQKIGLYHHVWLVVIVGRIDPVIIRRLRHRSRHRRIVVQ